MPRYKDEAPAVRVYTVCEESRYLIVRNVPALGCGQDLLKLFASYGDVEDFKPMDEEECEQFTDVYWIKFRLVSNSRFAKRKLDDFVFLGNRLQVSYAPQFETLDDTKDKLEARRREVLARLNHPGRPKGRGFRNPSASSSNALLLADPLQTDLVALHPNAKQSTIPGEVLHNPQRNDHPPDRVSSDQGYFPSESMNQTVRSVREKLNKIQSSAEQIQMGSASKKARVDNRRRI